MSRAFETITDRATWAIPAILLLFFAGLGAMSVRGKTPTVDEPTHYQYGINILNGHAERFDDSKMPVTALNAIPARLAELLSDAKLQGYFAPRMVTLGISVLIGLLVFLWSRSLYGYVPALLALLLYVFDPNIIAHSQLVTTDLYALAAFALAFYLLWRFARQRTPKNGLLCALALGLSQIAKYSALPLFGLFPLALLLHDLYSERTTLQAGGRRATRRFVLRFAGYLVIGGLISLLVINIGFLFDRTFTPFGAYLFRSDFLGSLQSSAPVLDRIPVPVPYPYLEGLDWVMQRERTGEGYGMIYLMGKLRKGEGFSGYFLLASLFKTPLAAQALVLTAVVVYFTDKSRRRNFFSNEMFLLLPVAFYIIYFNFFFRAQIGIRYYLVIFPFLYIFTGGLLKNWEGLKLWQKSLAGGAVLYLVISVLAYYPYYLTYFNELVMDKTRTYHYLADSNLDWGQSRPEFLQYFKDHKDARRPPTFRPEVGHFVISVNHLVGIGGDPGRFQWLRENFEPVGLVANYYLIYRISPAQIEALCQTTNYCL